MCAPKISICALLVKLDRLNTKDGISKWNCVVDRTFVLCTNQNEDGDHLFFTCSYSKQLLEEKMNKLQLNFLKNSVFQPNFGRVMLKPKK